MPCRNRSTTSRIGAQTPIVAKPGISPTATVDSPMISREAISMDLRPSRSPQCPNRMAPSGRAMKPTAKVASEARIPAVGENDGKNTFPNTSAAAVP